MASMSDITVRVENLGGQATALGTNPKARVRYQEAARDLPGYAEKAAGTPKMTYNPSTTNLRFALRAGVAIADWFHAPEVDEVDLSAWTGGVGEALPSHHRDWVQWW